MIRNFLKVAFRNLLKNKVYTLINICGLALGLAACFFIFQYIHFESSYDRFNQKAERIYRIPIEYTGSLASIPFSAGNHPAVGPAMKAEFPEVVDFTRMVNTSLFLNASTISYKKNNGEDITFNEGNIFVVDSSFFSMFSYPLIKGEARHCLAKAKSIVISETIAKKYFGNADPLNETIHLNGDLALTVTGVFKDVPENSHIKFDMLLSFETLGPKWGYTEWTYPEFYNYVLLAPGADPKKLEAKFPAFIEKHLGAKMRELNFRSYFHLQPITDIHLKSNYLKEAEANGSENEIAFLSIIGVFILVIAWINYINLSTAKSMERAKEVGLRKVVGAARIQLIMQFLFESLIINILALLASALLVFISMPLFSDFIGKNIGNGFFTTGLGTEPGFWSIVFFIFLVGALVVGAYPALILSSFRPVAVLKGLAVKSNTGISLRRALVSFQFILSIILIAATIIVLKQLSFMRNIDLGYNKDQLLVVKAPAIFDSTIGAKFNYFKSEVRKNSSVINVSYTSDIPGMQIRYRNGVRKANQNKSFNYGVNLMEVDENFINTFKISLIAGRNFGSQESYKMGVDDNTEILINEEIVTALGYKSAEEAVNQKVTFSLGEQEQQCTILGVVKNYHQKSLKEKYEPILYYYPAFTAWKFVTLDMNVGNLNQQLSSLEKLYKNSFVGNPFEYFFLDEFFNRQYQGDQRLGKVFGLFSILAIVVACMGLLGLSGFVIKLRTKEIGIRKVLGATLGSIMVLFSKDFARLVLLASVIAIPITYFAAYKWLMNYAFHIGLSWFIFVIPPLLLLAITLVTISLQSLRAVLANPVKSLRAE